MRLKGRHRSVQSGHVRGQAFDAMFLAGALNGILHHVEKRLPVAQHLVEAIGAETVQEGRHAVGRYTVLEQDFGRRPHLEVDEGAVAIETDEFGLECHGLIRCVETKKV
ncbi:hypothetical protein D9M68_907960 [compost metagenome]